MKYSWDRQIRCLRYHCTLPLSTCLIRQRLACLTGCAGCDQGLKNETEYGKKLNKEHPDIARYLDVTKTRLERFMAGNGGSSGEDSVVQSE